jgi:hypothetical protein
LLQQVRQRNSVIDIAADVRVENDWKFARSLHCGSPGLRAGMYQNVRDCVIPEPPTVEPRPVAAGNRRAPVKRSLAYKSRRHALLSAIGL